MTGRRLYEKYTAALGENKRVRWRNERYELAYPSSAPLAWAFLSGDQRSTWNTLARKLTPRKRAVKA